MQAVRIPGSGCVSQMDLDHAWHDIVKAVARNQILVAARRMDGRGLRDARLPRSAYSFLPSAHGSSLCNQGQTQALSTVTIGSPRPQRDSDASSSLEPFPRQFGVQYTSHAAEWNRVSLAPAIWAIQCVGLHACSLQATDGAGTSSQPESPHTP